MKLLLSQFSKLYGVATATRNALYDRKVLRTHRFSTPIICVGNITTGGNGKTPLCLYLASQLLARGQKPVLLSRGYGGALRGPHIVKKTDSPERVGDEPLLMARNSGAPVVIARDRVEGMKLIESLRLGDVIILDDGFQHRRLERNLDIVLVNVGTPSAIEQFRSGLLLPYGIFRENRDKSLSRADLVIFSERMPYQGSDRGLELNALIPKGIKTFRSSIEAKCVRSLQAKGLHPPAKVVAVCGIAHPRNFIETLHHMKFEVVASHLFKDHYRFSVNDLLRILAAHPMLPIVCTEKDAVKINEFIASVDQERVFVLETECRVRDSEDFMAEIMKTVGARSMPAPNLGK